MPDEFEESTEFDAGDDGDTDFGFEDEPTETDKVEVAVDDEKYRQESTPDEPSGFLIADKVQQGENFDPVLADSFKSEAHSLRLSQNQFSKCIDWWNKNSPDYDIEDIEDFVDKFSGFAQRNNIGREQVAGLVKWFGGVVKKWQDEFARTRKFADKSHGRPSSDGRIARIQKLTKDPAYTNKRDPRHKEVIQEILRLCKGQG